jgi:hypothetical protein
MAWRCLNIGSLDPRVQEDAARRIDNIVRDPKGLPNGKGKRTKLTPSEAHKFKQALIEALERAYVLASKGPLPNRIQRRGRPADNVTFIH